MAEHQRIEEYHQGITNWRKWGPYLSERAWGTVREDYSPQGAAWEYFPHDHARSRVFRWNEDGLAGISDRHQYICFSIALWNERDPILKERLFGLSGPEGNHGEDVKEYYFYLDNTPTHSYMKMLYRYPQAAFPYEELVEENGRRTRNDPEYELLDTGVLDDDRFFDVVVEYAKADPDDLLIRITINNRGPTGANCHLLPTIWFRNTWGWGYEAGAMNDVPEMPTITIDDHRGAASLALSHPAAGSYHLYAEGSPRLIFSNNETNMERLFKSVSASPYVKDAFHRLVIDAETSAVNPSEEGTKAAAWYRGDIQPGGAEIYRLRLSNKRIEDPFDKFDAVFNRRHSEADDFYEAIQANLFDEESRRIQRQAFAGLLWTKQLYYYDVGQWTRGDPGQPPPAEERQGIRNAGWEHLNNFDVLSMPDKWEYPWYAAWDLAFHTLPFALIDPHFAKRQLTLMTRAWYMHPNGQLPAYEWAFSDVNPPVHAWAALHVYKIEGQQTGVKDRPFLEAIFHKLLLNFTWWVNRKDADGNNIFQGGFLGLDNIGIFDRSAALPVEGHIDQADGTAWMAFYCLTMLEISLELAEDNPVYQDIATKFFEHFLRVANAISDCGGHGHSLWDEEDGFFYDALHSTSGQIIPIKVCSLVGLIPLLAVTVLEPHHLKQFPDFNRRLRWFIDNRPELSGNMASFDLPGAGHRHLLAILTRERLVKVLARMLDESEFLAPFGIRSMSKVYLEQPYTFQLGQSEYTLAYQPGESETPLFGGNSNWRGPIWFPINYLIIESLRAFSHYYGDELTLEFPTGSGQERTLEEIADHLSERLLRLFLKDEDGHRPIFSRDPIFQANPNWKDLILFHEYFHGESGAGLGASHQTGWTALIANLIPDTGR
ncbi:MAG: glucosidase [Anaerolineae bacterium]|nr:MAG: glucosidase [Anaerolineae bacterium]